MRSNLILMLDSMDNLMKVYQRVGPQSDLLQYVQRAQRNVVLGSYSWEVVKTSTKNIHVHRALFDIPMDCLKLGLLKLRYFRNEATTPHVYE